MPSAIDKTKLVRAIGDRGTVQLDARQSESQWHKDAVAFNGYRRPVYQAYQLIKGDSLLLAKPFTDIIKL